MRRSALILAACAVCTCRAKPDAQGTDAAAPVAQATSADGTVHCRTRLDLLRLREEKVRGCYPPADEVARGESAGWFCLGDPRSFYREDIERAGDGVCAPTGGREGEFCRLHNADLTFEHSQLVQIRLHRWNRRAAPSGRYLRSGVYHVPPMTWFGSSEVAIVSSLPGAYQRSVVNDSEFGELILLEYDGLTLELEKTDRGAELAGIVVKRNGT